MHTPILKSAMGCRGNYAFSHSPNQIVFEDTFVSHPGGPNEQFGTHEKLSCLNWTPGYMIVVFQYHSHCFGFNINLLLDQFPQFPIQIQNLQHVKFVKNSFIKLIDNR